MSTKIQYTVYQESPDLWVAQCLNLDIEISSDGSTEAEALENLREALNLHFENYVFPSFQKAESDPDDDTDADDNGS